MGAIGLFLTLIVSLGQSPSAKPDLSSPETTIRSFVNLFFSGELTAATLCLEDFTPDDRLVALGRELKAAHIEQSGFVRIASIKWTEQGDTAVATVKQELPVPKGYAGEETVNLKKIKSEWKIVPRSSLDLVPLAQQNQANPVLPAVNVIASAMPTLAERLVAREKARETVCTANLRDVSTAAMMLAQDYDEKFAVKADSYKAKIMPYIKKEAYFRCPGDKSGGVSYSFNRSIQGLFLANINYPAKTVLLYEGHNKVLEFRHFGKALVAFVDGHVKAVTAAEAKQLRWKP